jgi:hypothetical protein
VTGPGVEAIAGRNPLICMELFGHCSNHSALNTDAHCGIAAFVF